LILFVFCCTIAVRANGDSIIYSMKKEIANKLALEPALKSQHILTTDAYMLQLAYFQGSYLYIRLLEHLARESALTLSQFCTLWLLHATDRPLLASEIVHYVPAELSAVSILIDKLNEMGFVARRRSKRDRRIVEISITDKGHEKFISTSPAIFRAMQQIFEATSKSDMQKKMNSIQALRDRIIALSGKNTYPYEVYYRKHIKVNKNGLVSSRKRNNNHNNLESK
jgi:DNA-binding MarR family transcriptional regulator